MVKRGIFNPHLTYFSHIFFWTFFCLNHKTKQVRPFWVEKSKGSAPWRILWVPKHRKKTGFKFTNKNFQKWQKWPWHIQENLKWVGVVFQRKIFFLTKIVNKQLTSLSHTGLLTRILPHEWEISRLMHRKTANLRLIFMAIRIFQWKSHFPVWTLSLDIHKNVESPPG